jgi:hypothetical protein
MKPARLILVPDGEINGGSRRCRPLAPAAPPKSKTLGGDRSTCVPYHTTNAVPHGPYSGHRSVGTDPWAFDQSDRVRAMRLSACPGKAPAGSLSCYFSPALRLPRTLLRMVNIETSSLRPKARQERFPRAPIEVSILTGSRGCSQVKHPVSRLTLPVARAPAAGHVSSPLQPKLSPQCLGKGIPRGTVTYIANVCM